MGVTFDAVVVGSGAGGAAAAWRLTARGLRVLLLEAGPRFDPATDYRLDQTGWERRGFPAPQGSRAPVDYGDLGALDPSFAHLAAFDAAHPQRPRGNRRVASPNGYSHVQGVGGSTLHFTGEAHRLHPDSFRLSSLTGQGSDWPISYAVLEPYYAEIEDFVGVAGPADAGARWRSRPYPLPPHPLGPGSARIRAAAHDLGWHWSENARAALSVPRGDRPACNYCGQCSRGCPLGDKGSADVTYIRAALATGRLTLLPLAVVVKLRRGANGRILSLDYTQDGKQVRQETPLLFLAAGAVQTPRLLLAQADAAQPIGLANSSGQVGRNFMETLSYRASGIAPDLRLSHRGLPADSISWQFNAPHVVDRTAGGFRMTASVAESGLNGPIGHGTRLVAGFGAAFKQQMRDSFGSALSVAAIGAVIPDGRSSVGLSPDRRDAFGMPVPVINSVLTGNSLRLLDRMSQAARALLAQAGVSAIVEQASSWDGFGATHVFGTCRMGRDAASSVVDGACRSHDHDNLYITDASVFPASGGGESPSLTIAALAARAVDLAI